MNRVYLVWIFVVSLMLSCSVYGGNDIEKCRKRIINYKYLSYEIVVTYDTTSYNQKIYVNDNNICLLLRDTYFMNLSKSQYINIDSKREDFTVCKENYHSDSLKIRNWYYAYLQEFKRYNDMDLYSKFWSKDYAKKIKYKKDTLIENEYYKLYHTKTEDYDITYYYNIKLDIVDKINYINHYNPGESYEVTYEYKNFSFDNNEQIIDSIFSIDNPRWANLKMRNDTILPTSRVIFTTEKDTIMNDKVMTFPLVDVNNDTTSIEQQEGWLFLLCWCYTCVPCIEFAEKLQKEQEQFGSTVLENNGIKIMCLNFHAADIQKLKDFVKPYNLDRLFFGAKDMNKYLHMVQLPTYYLVSPNEQTVYVGIGKIDDYDEILSRKQEYEKLQ